MSAATRPLVRRGVEELPLLVVVVVLLATAANVLPGDAIVNAGEVKLTLRRLLILGGLAAVVAVHGLRVPRVGLALELPIALLLVVALVAAGRQEAAWPHYRTLVEGVALFFLAVAVARTRPDSRATLAWAALVAVAITALVGISQVSQDEATGFYRDGCVPVTKQLGAPPPGSLTRAVGTFENPNVLAGYLLLLVPIAAAAVGPFRRLARENLVPALVIVLGYLAVAFTFSRAAAIFAVLALAAGVVASRSPHRRYLLALAGVALVVVAFVFASCGSEAAAGYGRAEEWDDTIEVIGDEPVWGVGPGRLGDVLAEKEPRSTARHAHNLWLTWWAEAGTGALLAWLAIAAVLLWRVAAATRTGVPGAGASLVGLAGFLGFSLLDHPGNVDRVALAFWVVAALAVGLRSTADRSG
jgi:O-antigen ligase